MLDFDGGVRIGRGGKFEVLAGSSEPDWMQRAIGREWAAMGAAVRDGVTLAVGGREGAHLVACIEAAREAAASRREVAVRVAAAGP